MGGYRSDVAISMSHEIKDKIIKRIKEECIGDDDVKYMIEKLIKPNFENEHGIFIRFECIKWYRDYCDVKIIEEVLKEEEDDDNFKFIRLGEDSEDSEKFGYQENVKEFHMERFISVDDYRL